MTHLNTYLALADRSERTLAEALRTVAKGHAEAPDVFHLCQTLATFSDRHREGLAPVVDRYGEDDSVREPERLHADGLAEVRDGQIGLLRDLQDLHVLATLVRTTWTVIGQGAQGLRDRELLVLADESGRETDRQITWFNTRMKATAPQALIVAPPD